MKTFSTKNPLLVLLFLITCIMLFCNSSTLIINSSSNIQAIEKDEIKITKLCKSEINVSFNPISDCIIIESNIHEQVFRCLFYDCDGNITDFFFSINERICIKSKMIKKGNYILIIEDKKGEKIGKFELNKK